MGTDTQEEVYTLPSPSQKLGDGSTRWFDRDSDGDVRIFYRFLQTKEATIGPKVTNWPDCDPRRVSKHKRPSSL